MPIRRVQNGRGHRYTINGHAAYGVTTAIGDGWPKPQLMGWAARCVAEEAANILDKDDVRTWRAAAGLGTTDALTTYLKAAPTRLRNAAAVRGTRVHKLAEHLVRGDDVDVPADLVGLVDGCRRFMDEWRVRPVLVENVVGSYQWGYAGTFDLVADVPDGRRILFDYKTGNSGIWPDAALQLAAYRHADAYVADPSTGLEIPMKEVGITDTKAVWVQEGGFEVIPLDTGPRVFKAFLHVLQVAKARAVMQEWRGEPEPTP